MNMKLLFAGVVAAALISFGAMAADTDTGKAVKPYPLKTCVVSDEKFGGDMGDPYVFTYKNREVKLCCKGCLKDFYKEPEKYVKKMEAADKK
jgi:hypothetical protein